ncbi:hypothetical protein TNCT_268561 [Trichonephila clavata]|uniref:Uncharacterized protein n=1 Tax=Trichonephila clavata TaxID=2740835 RepID=A0A8X6G2B5_TRICU|nr:hypothetical protein TNCT_521571 [Trichonephila clavata]GFR27189.1 hypothetical protein TNCT_268561 [Trichonephila clavata]
MAYQQARSVLGPCFPTMLVLHIRCHCLSVKTAILNSRPGMNCVPPSYPGKMVMKQEKKGKKKWHSPGQQAFMEKTRFMPYLTLACQLDAQELLPPRIGGGEKIF